MEFSLRGAFDSDGAARLTRALMSQLDKVPASRFAAEPTRHPDNGAPPG
jgi:hypothetical protein